MGKVKNIHGRILCFFFISFFCGGVAALNWLSTKNTLDPWYVRLKDLSWTPPEWVFGPIWTWSILYGLLAIVGSLLFCVKDSPVKRQSLFLYFLQHFFTVVWFGLFFYLRAPISALFAMIVLLILIGTMLRMSWSNSRAAVYLTIPYLVWIFYIGLLNAITVHFH